MKPAKILARLLACSLAAGQLFSLTAGAAFNSGFTYSYPVGDGLIYSRSEGRNSSGLQKANILTYVPNTGTTPVMMYAGDKLYGSKSTITNAAQYLTGQGNNVLGGSNADFFVMASGVPIGLVIDKGELISSDAWQYAVGFKKDGSAVIGRPTMGIRVSGASGTVNVSYYNKTRTTTGAYILDKNYDSSSHFAVNGTSFILERVDDTPVKVNGTVKMRVASKEVGDSPLNIAPNQMVLTKSDGANVPSWVDFQIGEEVVLSIASNDPNWSEVQYAAGGKLLVNNGSVTTEGIDAGSTPRARTAIGMLADGRIVLYEIDGNQASHSAGLTAWELGSEMLGLGCVNAICLDGGGSSAMLVKQPGESTASLISSPSDGAERACANYIFFVGNVLPDGVTVHAALTPERRYLMPGASTFIILKGADASYGPAPDPEGMAYTVEGDMGTMSGPVFTATDKTGTVTITGSNGTVESYVNICVTDAVDSISLASKGSAVSSINVQAGESVDLDIVAYHQGQLMSPYDPAAKWSVSGDIGSVDENGVFTAGSKMGQGTVTCAFGAVSSSVNVNVNVSVETPNVGADKPNVSIGEPQDATIVADFDGDPAVTASEGVTISAVNDFSEVVRGIGSLKASYGTLETGTGNISFPDSDASGMHYVTLWARSAGGQSTITATFTAEDGSVLTSPFNPTTSETWQQLSAVIPEGAKAFTGISFTHGPGTDIAALYLDHIVLTSDHAPTNPDAPYISLDSKELYVDADNAAVITGTATMEGAQYPVRESNIEVKLNGKPFHGTVSMDGTKLTVVTPRLVEGTHCVTIDVLDDAGNRNRASATITAGGGGSAFADTGIHWAGGYASLLSETGIMQGELKEGIPYFYPNRNLRRVEFAVTMARMLELDTSYTGRLNFADDASIPSWARGAVYAVAQRGIMNGRQNQNGLYFAPNDDMTRAEVMTVIGRSLPRGYAGVTPQYNDAAAIPDWALEQVKACIAAGIIGGYQDNTLKPLGSITRGEIAKILALY